MKVKFFDGFVNLLKSFGSSNDTREQTTYGATKRISRLWQVLEDLYATSWLAAKVVDIPVEDAFREGRTFNIEKTDTKKALEDFYIQIDDKIELGLKYARIYGGAALILVSTDDNLSKPITSMQQGDLINIAVVDTTQLIPQNLDRNPLSITYLKPTSFNIIGSSQAIDESRVIYIDGTTTTHKERELNNGFGSSIYERLYYNIQDASQTNVSIRNLVEQSNLDVVAMDGLNEAVSSGDAGETAVKERIQILSQMKSILNTIAIDSKDSYVNIAKNFSTLDSIQMNMFMLVSAAADIPFTRFMGKSAEGLSATGEGDLRNYYDSVKSKIQIGKLKRIYDILDPIVNIHLNGVDEPFDYEFNPLYQMSKKELADINKIQADTYAIYLDRGVVTDEAVLLELQKSGQFVDYDPSKIVEF